MNELVATITQIGKQKSFNAQMQGIKIKITHLAVGTKAYTPDEGRTALQNEKERVSILSSEINPTEQTITVYTVIQSQQEYWINEIGLFLEDGTLFAIWSHPTTKLGYKSQLNKFLLGFRLKLVNVPINTVQIIDQGADLRLFFSEEFLKIGNALTLIGDAVVSIENDIRKEVKDRGDAIKEVLGRIAEERAIRSTQHYEMLAGLVGNASGLTMVGDALVAHVLNHPPARP